jgi:hypothetical protein
MSHVTTTTRLNLQRSVVNKHAIIKRHKNRQGILLTLHEVSSRLTQLDMRHQLEW